MKKGDLVIIILVALLVTSSFFISFVKTSQAPATVTVTVAGEKLCEYPLNKDFETKITTDLGENTLTIKDGYADITAADCQNNDCVHQKKISKNGEIIVCLPHKLVVSITSADTAKNDF